MVGTSGRRPTRRAVWCFASRSKQVKGYRPHPTSLTYAPGRPVASVVLEQTHSSKEWLVVQGIAAHCALAEPTIEKRTCRCFCVRIQPNIRMTSTKLEGPSRSYL